MNFFGHAVLARRYECARGRLRAPFVLGAMLPDFASMLRVRPPRTSAPELDEGMRFHHATDDAFHGSAAFLEFSRLASTDLRARGLSTGSARAVGHVGVELLLDAALARENGANEAYLSALESGLHEQVGPQIHWETSQSVGRFQHLCHTLLGRGEVRADASPELMAERLRTILAARPRLALDDAGQSVVRDWVVTTRPMIESQAKDWLRDVEQRLENATGFDSLRDTHTGER